MADTLTEFVADEGPALEQLRRFVGGGADKFLDGSAEGLCVLDAYVANLTREPDWDQSTLFADLGDVRTWLAIRIAYYLGTYARRCYGSEWYMSTDDDSPVKGTPVMAVHGIEFSPLEVATALLNHEVDGGLVGVFADLEAERLKTKIPQ